MNMRAQRDIAQLNAEGQVHLNVVVKLVPLLHCARERAASHSYVSGRAIRGRRNV